MPSLFCFFIFGWCPIEGPHEVLLLFLALWNRFRVNFFQLVFGVFLRLLYFRQCGSHDADAF